MGGGKMKFKEYILGVIFTPDGMRKFGTGFTNVVKCGAGKVHINSFPSEENIKIKVTSWSAQ